MLSAEEERIATFPGSGVGPPPLRYTGDSLPALASLLTGGLLEISRRYSGASSSGMAMPMFEVRLTDRGCHLVAAWKAGQPDAIRAALAVAPSAP